MSFSHSVFTKRSAVDPVGELRCKGRKLWQSCDWQVFLVCIGGVDGFFGLAELVEGSV